MLCPYKSFIEDLTLQLDIFYQCMKNFFVSASTVKKENQIFSSYVKEIQMGSGAKSYISKGFLIYEEMRKFSPIYEEDVSHK
jgi:hypothetical protein